MFGIIQKTPKNDLNHAVKMHALSLKGDHSNQNNMAEIAHKIV